jgi:hypothetical protein
MDIIGAYIGVYIAVRITVVAIILIATTATITVIATAATITITAATIITGIAIGETIALSKQISRRVKVAAHAAAFSLLRPSVFLYPSGQTVLKLLV